jgi:hypothetical protein
MLTYQTTRREKIWLIGYMLKKINCFFSPFLLCQLVLFNLHAQEKDEFKLIKKEGPISIFERWVVFPGSNPPVTAREVKGEFTFNNSIYAALALLKNEKKIKDWQHHVSKFKVYLQKDTSTWLEYSYHDIPWPVSDQDHFLEYKLDERKPGQELFITFVTKKNDKLAPVEEGVTRMRLAGSWKLEQLSDQTTKATYCIRSMPIGIPRFFTDPVIHRNIMITIKEFIALMNKKH